jgi:hypothetical protein
MAHAAISKKVEASNIFNCSDLQPFIDSVQTIMRYSGQSGSRFFMCEYEGYKFLTKFCIYKKHYIELSGIKQSGTVQPTDAEIRILKIFKEKFIETNITPCIIELIYDKVCEKMIKLYPSYSRCEELIISDVQTPRDEIEQTVCNYVDLINNDLAFDKCAFLVLEKCDITFAEYINKSINTPVSLAVFKSLLFQIIYTIYAISIVYPEFRHGDFHADNIVLMFDPMYKFKFTNPKCLIYHIDDNVYSVPYFGIIPKIIDFERSTLPEEGINNVFMEDKWAKYYTIKNDLLVLYGSIYEIVVHAGTDKFGRVDKILSSLDPDRMHTHTHPEYIRTHEREIPTYKQMATNKIFDEYKQFKAPISQIYKEFTPVST